MKLVRTEIKAEIYGTEYSIRKPTYKEVEEYRAELMKENENSNAAEIMSNFLDKMGLPKQVFSQLEIAHVSEIMDVVMDAKKK